MLIPYPSQPRASSPLAAPDRGNQPVSLPVCHQYCKLDNISLVLEQGTGRTGPTRTNSRTRPHTDPSGDPYPSGRPQRPLADNRVALWPRCPRNGIQWVASRRSGWEPLDAPSRCSNPKAVEFITSLSHNLSVSMMTEHSQTIRSFLDASPTFSQAATGTELEGASALTTILTRCQYASQCDAASSFGVMVSRIQLAMKCKRYAQMLLRN